MRLQIALILTTVLSDYVTAFAPSPMSSRARSSLLRIDPRPRVFPTVDLPSPADIPEEIPYPYVDTKAVQDFLFPTLQASPAAMLNRPKSEKLVTMPAKLNLISSQKLDTQIPNPKAYQFFGNGEHAKNLVYLLKTNPFMASALEAVDDGFELKAFHKGDKATGDDKSAPFFRRIMNCLNGGAGHRVNFFFDSDMNIKNFEVYDEISGKKKILGEKKNDGSKGIMSDKDELDRWASSALYNLGVYASSVHATMHVLHYLLTAGLDFSSQGFEAMNQWAKVYATNIPAKYGEVGSLLIRGQPNPLAVLGGGALAAADPTIFPASLRDEFAIITGGDGFGADGKQLSLVLVDMLNMWMKNPSKFLDKMTNITDEKEKMKNANILTEFMKHNNLVPGFAQDVKSAFKAIDEKKLGISEDRLVSYFKRCSGFDSKIDSLEDWIQLMATTGIVHGCTLSYTRLFADVDILRWRDIQSNAWEIADVNIHTTLLATICGMDEHRHVMTSSTDVVGEEYERSLQFVLEKYEKMANDYKEAYTKEIVKDKIEFYNYGWILSDFCVDGFDGKQLTIATYI